MKKITNILPEQRFTRTVFGVIMIGSAFIPGVRRITFVLEIFSYIRLSGILRYV